MLKKYFIIPLIAAATCLTACFKTNPVESINYSGLRVVNAAGVYNTYNVYLDNKILNSAALPFQGNINFSQKELGSYTIKFTAASNTTSVYSNLLDMSQSAYYSYYLVGKPEGYSELVINDNLSVPTEGKAYIRLVHLSPDAANLDLGLVDATDKLITGKSFKTASDFVAIDPGSKSINVYDSASGTVKSVVSDFNFTENLHYEVVVGGYDTPADDTERPLKAHIILIK